MATYIENCIIGNESVGGGRGGKGKFINAAAPG